MRKNSVIAACSFGLLLVAHDASAADTLVIGQPSDIINFNPTQLATGNYAYLRQVYDTLVVLDDARLPQPYLAASFKQADDGRSVTFKLKNAKFHSGRPVTADDFVSTLAFTKTQKSERRSGSALKHCCGKG